MSSGNGMEMGTFWWEVFLKKIEDAPTWKFYRTWKMMGFSAPTFSLMDIFSSVPLLERQRCQKCSRNSRGRKSLRHLHFGLAKALAPYMAMTHPEPPRWDALALFCWLNELAENGQFAKSYHPRHQGLQLHIPITNVRLHSGNNHGKPENRR